MSSIPATASGPARAARPAYWFALALFGLIVAVSVPLHEVELNTAPPPVGWVGYAPLARTVSSAAYSSSLSVVAYGGGGPLSVPGGWYWAGALALAFLLTTMWCRRTGREAGQARPGWPYLVTGLVLTAVITAVPPLLTQRVWLPDMPPQPHPAALLLVALLLLVAATLSFGRPILFGWPAWFRRHRHRA